MTDSITSSSVLTSHTVAPAVPPVSGSRNNHVERGESAL
jgi:hypothetical protein